MFIMHYRSMTHRGVSSNSPQEIVTQATGEPSHHTAAPTLNNIDHLPRDNHNPSLTPPIFLDVHTTTNGPILPKQRAKTVDRDTDGSLSDNEVLSRNLRRRELRGTTKLEPSVPIDGPCPTIDDNLQKIQRLKSLKQPSANGSFVNGGSEGSPMSASHRNAVTNHRGDGTSTNSLKDDNHVLRSRTASSLRVRPYPVNHKPVNKLS